MAGFGDLLQKAFYMGVGIASYLPEVANRDKINELRDQAQKLAEELVARGEMTAEEAKHTVEDMLKQAQDAVQQVAESTAATSPTTPRPIEIVVEEVTPDGDQPVTVTSKVPTQAAPAAEEDVDTLRQRVAQLQEELSRLQQHSPNEG
jgi:polyhydroxyalkanoate synthesis regulator phasin